MTNNKNKAKYVRMLFFERKSRGWTREYVSKWIGISPSYLRQIENGDYVPSYRRIVALEGLFRVNSKNLMMPVTADDIFIKKSIPYPADVFSAEVINNAEIYNRR